jgi:hypothetical protein
MSRLLSSRIELVLHLLDDSRFHQRLHDPGDATPVHAELVADLDGGNPVGVPFDALQDLRLQRGVRGLGPGLRRPLRPELEDAAARSQRRDDGGAVALQCLPDAARRRAPVDPPHRQRLPRLRAQLACAQPQLAGARPARRRRRAQRLRDGGGAGAGGPLRRPEQVDEVLNQQRGHGVLLPSVWFSG